VPSTIPQPVVAPLTRAAMFLVVTVNAEPACDAAVRALCGDLAGLLRAIGFRDLDGRVVLHHGVRLRCLGPVLRRSEAARTASVP
jgi:porphyrinogen peroxidase